MASNRAGRGGRSYTPKSGPFAGETFASDYTYRQARAIYLGYSGVSEQRRTEGVSAVQTMADIIQHQGDVPRGEAMEQAREWYRNQPYKGRGFPKGQGNAASRARKASAMRYLHELGLMPDAREEADNEFQS